MGPLSRCLLQTNSWIYISEILPASWMGYGVASSWTFTILVGVFAPYMLEGIGRWTFLVFSIFMILVLCPYMVDRGVCVAVCERD